jgi:hypothetical protein
MAITHNMNLEEMKSFLDNELKEQILLEIAPILYVGLGPGGYFGVCRQVLCLLDFLSTLYFGYDESKDKKYKQSKGLRREISLTENAINFIRLVMGEKIDPYYRLNGDKLYKMYRHGLVHLYQPKTFKLVNGQILSWLAYKGPRERANVELDGVICSGVRHLREITHPKDPNRLLLAISINCLYHDLLSVIDIYASMLASDKNLQANWISAANAISEFENLGIHKT